MYLKKYVNYAVGIETELFDFWTSVRSAISGMGSAFVENRSFKYGSILEKLDLPIHCLKMHSNLDVEYYIVPLVYTGVHRQICLLLFAIFVS